MADEEPDDDHIREAIRRTPNLHGNWTPGFVREWYGKLGVADAIFAHATTLGAKKPRRVHAIDLDGNLGEYEPYAAAIINAALHELRARAEAAEGEASMLKAQLLSLQTGGQS